MMMRAMIPVGLAIALVSCGKAESPFPSAASSPATEIASSASTETAAASMAETSPPAAGASAKQELVAQLSGVWRPIDEQLLMTISAEGDEAFLLLADQYLHADVEDVDVRNGVITLAVDLNGKRASWSFRRITDERGMYHFRSMLHTGHETELSFVRELTQGDMTRLATAHEQDRLNKNAAQKALHDAAPDSSR